MVVLQYINTILVVLQWNGDNAIILVLQYWWYCIATPQYNISSIAMQHHNALLVALQPKWWPVPH